MIDVSLETILAPAAEHAPSVQVGVRSAAIRPVVAAVARARGKLVA